MATVTFTTGLIKEIQEWASVFFVKFFKGRPSFVSKNNKEIKAMSNLTVKEPINAYQWACKFTESQIYTSSTGTLKMNVWSKKKGEHRIYLKTWKGADLGYLSISENGDLSWNCKSYIQKEMQFVIDELDNKYDITPVQTTKLISKDNLSNALCYVCNVNTVLQNGLCCDCID